MVDLEKLQKAKEILQRVFKTAEGFTRNGFPIVDNEILSLRESICKSCDEWDATALNGTGRCRICKCSTWAKLRMATEECPLGKWQSI